MLKDESPWRFLSPLDGQKADDRELLRSTRAGEIRVISDMVAAAKVSILYAFSGNGKTSLVEAGLIPFFQEHDYAVFRIRPRPPWACEDPIRAFKECVIREMRLPAFGTTENEAWQQIRAELESIDAGKRAAIESAIAEVELVLRKMKTMSFDEAAIRNALRPDSDETIQEFVGRARTFLPRHAKILIICDQFEELFVHYANTAYMEEYVRQLGELHADDSLMVHLLFSMREDWVGSMIEFRRAIPDIFTNYFKLNPITRRRASAVLTQPLVAAEVEFELHFGDEVLDDLAQMYSLNQSREFAEVKLTRSPQEDPFIELPALQIVADRMWQTRNEVPKPFSKEHYLSLKTKSSEGRGTFGNETPAQTVVDGYLTDLLDQIHDNDRYEPNVWREMRIDCLYLLTDGSRHRRALTKLGLLDRLNRLRPAELKLPRIDDKTLEELLGPLREFRLVRQETIAGAEKQYELSHDFAVRAVVRAWRVLDRARSVRLAIESEARERTKERLTRLVRKERKALRFLQIFPALPIIGLLIAAIGALLAYQPLTWVPYLVMLLVPVCGLLVIVVASLQKHWTSLALGTMTMAGCALLLAITPAMMWILSPDQPHLVQVDGLSVEGQLNPGDTDVYAFAVAPNKTVTADVTTDTGIASATLFARTSRSAPYYLQLGLSSGVFPGETVSLTSTRQTETFYYLLLDQGFGGDYTVNVSTSAGDDSEKLSNENAIGTNNPESTNQSGGTANVFSFEREPNDVPVVSRLSSPLAGSGWITVGVVVLSLLIYLFSVSSLDRLLERKVVMGRLLRVLWSELLEIVSLGFICVLVFAIVGSVAVGTGVGLDLALFTFGIVAYIILSSWSIRTFGWTPGFRIAGFAIRAEDGAVLSFGRAVLRQSVFVLWTGLNAFFGVLWLVVGPIVIRNGKRQQNLYDTIARTTLIENKKRTMRGKNAGISNSPAVVE